MEPTVVTAELLEHFVSLIDRERVLADLMTMVRIPSVNPFGDPPADATSDDALAAWYDAALSAIDFVVDAAVIAPGRTNVVGRIAGSGGATSVMLAGHLDTVGVEDYPTAFAPRIDDGRLYGRGSCDMKAALAAYLEVGRVLREAGVRLAGDLVIAGLCDEEHTMIGSRHLGTTAPVADVAIIGEPSDLQVCPAHKGQVCVVIRTFGTAVHSSTPELGRNAIVDMTKVIAMLDEYAADLMARPAHPLCGHARVNAGVIRGGTIASTVPDSCDLEIDRRTLPGETVEQVLAELTQRLDAVARANPGFRYELVGPTLVCNWLDTDVDEPLVAALLDTRRVVVGGGEPMSFAAATDAPNLGIPVVVCGPGRLEQAHTTDEYVEIDQVVQAVEVYLRAVLTLAGRREPL